MPDDQDHWPTTPEPERPAETSSPRDLGPVDEATEDTHIARRAEATERRPRRAAGAHRAGVHADNFQRTVLFTILGAIIPGVGLIAARRRVAGVAVLAVFVLAVGGLALWGLGNTDAFLGFMANGANLKRLTVALIVVAVAWVTVIVVSHLALRGRRLAPAQRVGGSILVALLAFVVAAPMAVAAKYSYTSADVVNSVFKSDKDSNSATVPKRTVRPNSGDPWAQTPRVNILLLGGDSGPDRTGTRTDSIMLASIDTRTGATTLIGIPRNTARMPFPKNSPLHKYFPNGYTDGNGEDAQYFANAIYGMLPTQVPKDVLGKTDNLGADALKLSVGEATGLPVDYYVMLNLAGFKELVNALGGITVNINTRIPIGGDHEDGRLPTGYLTPGPNQHLMGEKALWYARSRYDSSDFDRMDRQRCVVNAIVEQANPANVLARYQQIAEAGKDLVETDIPQEELSALVDLSMRVKKADSVRSVTFVNGEDGFISANPNFALMRARVKAAITESSATKTSSGGSSSSASSPSSSSGSPSSTSTKKPTAKQTASVDVSDACAYHPGS